MVGWWAGGLVGKGKGVDVWGDVMGRDGVDGSAFNVQSSCSLAMGKQA